MLRVDQEHIFLSAGPGPSGHPVGCDGKNEPVGVVETPWTMSRWTWAGGSLDRSAASSVAPSRTEDGDCQVHFSLT